MHSDAIGLAFAAFHTWSQEPGYEAYLDYNFMHAVRINILDRASGFPPHHFHSGFYSSTKVSNGFYKAGNVLMIVNLMTSYTRDYEYLQVASGTESGSNGK